MKTKHDNSSSGSGEAEYTFLSALDGETTLSTALATTCSQLGVTAFSEQDAVQFCKWLIDVGLAQTLASVSVRRQQREADQQRTRQWVNKLNPISIAIPLFELDRITTAASRYFNRLIGWPLAAIGLAVCLIGFVSLAIRWERMAHVDVFSRDQWLWLALTWLVLKFVHEAAHVLMCKKFGGRIGKGGILLLLMIPMPYVDVTSSWRFPNKSKRILVAAAGMLAEIFLASVAALVWCSTEPGPLHYHAAQVMVAASLHTLLFNANPLMRFDGYHILADSLEIPNLGNHGQQYVVGC